MLLYILKFSACLAIFLVFYKLCLEKQNMHAFKRFYLLGTLILALSIPLITFTSYVNVEPIETSKSFTPAATETSINEQFNSSSITNYWPYILWFIYGFGILIFSIRFVQNLHHLLYKIHHNPKQINNKITNVLLKEDITPHTFFRYIFFNKQKFEAHVIPQEVFWHEETHAKQKHSLDVLFIELFQIIFWFNPLIYFFKRHIKLNHEFLADQGVLNKGILPNTYQQLLLEFSTNQPEHQLTNAINYSLIKKRFTVMKTQTSKRNFWLRSLILLPILAFTLYSFSSREIIEVISESNTSNTLTARSIDIKILNNNNFEVDNIKTSRNNLGKTLSKLHTDITKEQRDNIINIHVSSEKDISYDNLVYIQKVAKNYGYYRIVTPYEEIIRSKGNTPMRNDPMESDDTLYARSISLKILTNDNLEVDNIKTSKNNLSKTLSKLHTDITKEQRDNVINIHVSSEKDILYDDLVYIQKVVTDYGYFRIVTPTEEIVRSKGNTPVFKTFQDKASPKQIKEYNKLAKYYNNLPEDDIIIKLKDMTRIRELYDLMSDTQKKNAEPFPNFPPPPPPPPFKKAPQQEDYLLKGIAFPEPLPKNATVEQKRKYSKAVEDYKNQGYGYKYEDKGREITVIISDVAPPPPPVVKEVIPPPSPPVKKSKNAPEPHKLKVNENGTISEKSDWKGIAEKLKAQKETKQEEIALAKALEKSVAQVSQARKELEILERTKQRELVERQAKVKKEQLVLKERLAKTKQEKPKALKEEIIVLEEQARAKQEHVALRKAQQQERETLIVEERAKAEQERAALLELVKEKYEKTKQERLKNKDELIDQRKEIQKLRLIEREALEKQKKALDREQKKLKAIEKQEKKRNKKNN